MRLLADAWKALKDYPQLVAVYVLGHMSLVFVQACAGFFLNPDPETKPAQAAATAYLVVELAIAAAIAAWQAIVLARLGRELDKPLWRWEGDGDALRRFFTLWLLVNLTVLALIRLDSNALGAGFEGLAILLELVFIGASILLFPAATCIMHFGKLEWTQLNIALRPMARQLPLAAIVFLIMLFQVLFFISLGPMPADLSPFFRRALYPALTVGPLAFIEIFAFAAAWIVCIIDRDTPEDNDFEF